MKILTVTIEVAPLTVAGGLARSCMYLTRELVRLKHDARVITPMHYQVSKRISQKFNADCKKMGEKRYLQLSSSETLSYQLFELRNSQVGHIYLVDNKNYFSNRTQIYDYQDDNQRFYFFSAAVLDFLVFNKKNNLWIPDIVHCHDWHTGYLIDLARTSPEYKRILKDIKIAYTVHNFSYQNKTQLQYMNQHYQDSGKEKLAEITSEKISYQNPLIRGLLHADLVNTVSQTHSLEVQTAEYSYNLSKITQKINHKLSGILNGVDQVDFNPMNVADINTPYTLENYQQGKAANKSWLQKKYGLEVKNDTYLFCYVGRIVLQKGIELLLRSFEWLLEFVPNSQLVVLGDGDAQYMDKLYKMHKRLPTQVGLHLVFDSQLPKQFYAAADFLVCPSEFEPGGNVVLEALQYGCIPVVRRTGGMSEIVQDFDTNTMLGNGFTFNSLKSLALYAKLVEAIVLYKNNQFRHRLITNAMKYDRGWDQAAKEYVSWYSQLYKT